MLEKSEVRNFLLGIISNWISLKGNMTYPWEGTKGAIVQVTRIKITQAKAS